MILGNVDNKSLDILRVIHEVKNSFMICNGYLDIIEANNVDDDINGYVSVIKDEINRSSNIIREFLNGGDGEVVKKNIDFKLFLDSVCREMELYVNSKSLSFEYNLFREEVFVSGDCNKLKQVIINLIENSVEACLVGGKIIVNSYLVDGDCCVEIIDDGCGMDSDVLEMIGRRFFSTKKSGSGIGVNFCKDIIKKHDGNINYYSVKDRGTKVVVKIPVVML